ncbi:DUF4340 domain-containing protein [Paraglaciecola hydrolytica]|uniref:DUF4340 domain-containing protein n=1 Tax=Paraglaciecola hydrolytica TaxID=1799789 RepID=A0A136A0B9_9ALTE|nr:DUF4340 domain-containing protein [Paraglaciecola hydrolytica]KXI28699.1 hypothetical protein AX660_16645 [Paraglaciecola hydrolytica]
MNKQLGLLVLIALLAVGGGVWLSHQSESKSSEVQLMFVDGSKKASKITAVSLQNSQGSLLQAELIDGQWMAKLAESGASYPLDKTALADFIQSLVQAKLQEAKTAKKENYHHLGVEAIDDVDSLATLVSITSSDAAKPWQILIGNKVNTGQGSYVRMPQVSQSWKVDQTINLPSSKFDWLKRPILSISKDDIESISRSDNKGWSIVTDDEAEFKLKAMPKGRELRYPGVVTALVSSILELDFEQLLALDDAQWQKAKVISKLTLKTKADEVIQLKVASLDNSYFIQFSSEQLNNYWLDWTYQVSSFNAQQLTKSLEDFLAELPKASDAKARADEIEEGDSPL